MATDDEVKKDLWGMVKSSFPKSVILLFAFYVMVVGGGTYIYNAVVKNNERNDEYIKQLTNNFLLALVIFTIIVLILGIILFVMEKKRTDKTEDKLEVKQEELPKGMINAFIVEQDEPSRNDKFKGVNHNVKRDYWVLGVSLESIVGREKTLEKMAKDNINIRLCMMNPNIAVDSLCVDSVEQNVCVILKNLVEEIKNGTVEQNVISDKMKKINNYDDLSALYHILINAIHFKEYYFTDTDYKGRVKNSYENLKRIKRGIQKKGFGNFFDLKVADSFMPMSLTITDAHEESGRMVVEFHLPFTQYKVLFEINKRDNEKFFNVFVEFYDVIWNRAKGEE